MMVVDNEITEKGFVQICICKTFKVVVKWIGRWRNCAQEELKILKILINNDATVHIKALRLYFAQQKMNTFTMMCKLSYISDFVEACSASCRSENNFFFFSTKKMLIISFYLSSVNTLRKKILMLTWWFWKDVICNNVHWKIQAKL